MSEVQSDRLQSHVLLPFAGVVMFRRLRRRVSLRSEVSRWVFCTTPSTATCQRRPKHRRCRLIRPPRWSQQYSRRKSNLELPTPIAIARTTARDYQHTRRQRDVHQRLVAGDFHAREAHSLGNLSRSSKADDPGAD